ncbi:MAG: glycosyltransferase family 39 protein [Nitrospirota bacterium]|nr:glycosyltransferase family 39 protein [Nitrospirota bacterium]
MSLPEIDIALFFIINKGLQNFFFDAVMPFVTKHAELVFLPLVLWAAAKEKKGIWPFLLVSLFAVALADGSGHILKDIAARQRPCHAFTDINLLVGCGRSYSMPSSHAANAFAFAMSFLFLRRNSIGYFSLAAAVVIAFSRIYVGVHYPFDVLAGMLLGTCGAYASLQLYRWGERIYAKKAYGEALGLSVLLISLFRIWFIQTGPFDLTPDEAHYWEWSRHIDWSYYSKGPVIAYLIYLGTALFGDTVFGIRIFAVVLSAVSSLLVYLTARDLYDKKTGFASALLIQIVPLYAVYGVLFTIDSPFMFFWILSLYLFHKILQRQGHGAPGKRIDHYWILLGVSAGLGLLTKYTMAFFYFSAFLFMLASKDNRKLLNTAGPYMAVIIGLTVFSPVIYWNAANEWVTLKHTAGQAHVAEGLRISPKRFFEFIGSQIGVITPVLFALVSISLWRMRKDRKGAFLFWFSVPTIAFFVLKSLQGKVQANWALPGYAAGFIAFSAHYIRNIESSKRGMKLLVSSGVLLALLVTSFAHFPSILRLPQKKDPTSRLVGWRELGHEAGMVYRELSQSAPAFIVSDKYQVSSELAFYTDGQPATYCINLGRRMNQYDLWPGFESFIGYNAVFVRTSQDDLPEEVKEAFGHCDKKPVTIQTRQKKIVKFTIFKCYDFKGMKMRTIESF